MYKIVSRVLFGDRLAILSAYFRRLLSPPLPGDGLLVVGLVEGIVGWATSWLFVSSPSLAPFGVVRSIVALWLVLTITLVGVGVMFTAPTVRRNRIWLVWAGLNSSAVFINVTAVAGLFPGPAKVLLVADYLGAGYWRPWFLALAIGYLATALHNWSSPQLRRSERVVYGLSGAVCVLIVAPWPVTPLLGERLFLVGGMAHVLPMGFDIVADIVLILRRSG